MSSFGVMKLSDVKTNTMLGMYTNTSNRIWASLIFENYKSALSFLAKYYGGGN